MENALANVDLGRYRRIVQMFWDPEPINDVASDQPIWCLGQMYRLGTGQIPSSTDPRIEVTNATTLEHPNADEIKAPEAQPLSKGDEKQESTPSSFSSSLAYEEPNQGGGWPQDFINDFEARFWMTYRSEFGAIPSSNDPRATSSLSLPMRIKKQLNDQSGFSSDSGWGCMIRSGQSLLANTLSLQRLGRGWRRGDSSFEERQLIGLFADDPQAPYSIHNFVKYGASSCGKYPGEWFGPSATARCIQALANDHEASLRVYVAGDGHDVYEDSFMKIAKPDGHTFIPTLILVGTRLGIDKITPVYWEALIATLQMPQSVGIAGGRPSSAHYFAGSQGSFLFYLDPHNTRKALPYRSNPGEYSEEEIDSCHTNRLRRVHVREMDPSMLIGFLIRSEEDWSEWRRSVKHVQGKAIIHVADRDPMLSDGAGTDGRWDAIDEVEPLSDDDDEDDDIIPGS